MTTLILVRHSAPAIEPRRAADEWPLSDEGRRRCAPLAERLIAYRPGVIVTSAERKAAETGQLIAGRLRAPVEVVEGLHEHDQRGVPFGDRDGFRMLVKRLFTEPDALVFGNETARQAHARFAAAIESVLARYPDDTVAVVTHGTVLMLFVAWANGLEPFAFWDRLGLPAFVVLSRPRLAVLHVAESVVEDGA